MDKFYVVITGSDGSGKETQTKKLEENLKLMGLKVKKISFPNYDSPSSGAVKLYLCGALSQNPDEVNPYQASLLYAMDRFCTMKQFLNEDNDADVVIFDRYAESNIIHQAIKIKEEKEIKEFIDWLDDIEFKKLGIPRPNLTLFLNMPTEVSFKLASERKGLKNEMSKDIHENNYNFLKRSYDFGMKVAKDLGWVVVDCCDNNGLRTREAIADDCLAIVKNALIQNGVLTHDVDYLTK